MTQIAGFVRCRPFQHPKPSTWPQIAPPDRILQR